MVLANPLKLGDCQQLSQDLLAKVYKLRALSRELEIFEDIAQHYDLS